MHADSAPHAASRPSSHPQITLDTPGPRADPSTLLADVLRCYTARTGPELASLFTRLYAPDTAFIDPFAHASPRQEALLQFLSLQHLFAAVEATPVGPPVISNDGASIAADISFKYTWSRGSWLAQTLLPEVTPVEATVTLHRDATGAIVSHVDHWKSPLVAALPTIVRKANVRALNAVFRLLGWENELRSGTGAVAAAADKNEPQTATKTVAASKEE